MKIEIGQNERKTQNRVIRFFIDELGYEYIGDLSEGQDNSNIIEARLEHFLFAYQEYDQDLIRRAINDFVKTAGDLSLSLYYRNQAVYQALRYGVQVKSEVGAPTETVWLIDWKTPERNQFAIAEEVTILPPGTKGHEKRPDLVLYVNGIALGVIELKRGSVDVAEGIRQNLDNQKEDFIQPFFSTLQMIMAGNDSQGLRYWTLGGYQKNYLTWKEDGPTGSQLDNGLRQLCNKTRFLELIHDFILFDAGQKKICRHNQYFAVRAAQARVVQREGGIIWNTQGSGKSFIMVWLAKWIREHIQDSRILVITDRTELDDQIEKVFKGVNEDIYRTRSGAELVQQLNTHEKWLLCSLIHKFGRKDGEETETNTNLKEYVDAVKKALPYGYKAKGTIFVFIDECHRTQSGELHEAMKALLPEAVFIGFTGTPLLKTDKNKKKSIEIFGGYIHTYKFDEAVKDEVVLDLRYEARDIEQTLTSPTKVDQWFEAKTRALTPLAKAQLKKRWGTMQKVLSSQSRLGKIVADIMLDMEQRERLQNGYGNALLVAGSVYEACKYYELFSKGPLSGHCGIVTSYVPKHADIKGEETGEGATEALEKYGIYRQMLAEFFNEPPEKAMHKVEAYEQEAKRRFINEPGQMKLLIVVDKLLTGFDAPPATYLYIDKSMRDHGLFQAICRVNRLDENGKDYGYIIDYKDLFKSLEGAVKDYTSGALDGYDKEDVAGLLENRLVKGKERLDKALESIRALCEPVEPPKDLPAYLRYFSYHEDPAQLKATEPQRMALYKMTASVIRAYADIANEMEEAGYLATQAERIKVEVAQYEDFRSAVKIHSCDAIDLKEYEPAMRHLIDTYIRAEDSKKVSAFEDLSLVELVVSRGYQEAVKALPKSFGKKQVAETVENNVRKVILEQSPVNPKYYEKMSELLESLIEQRRKDAVAYEAYLAQIEELARKAHLGPSGTAYPKSIATKARKALYDNFREPRNFSHRHVSVPVLRPMKRHATAFHLGPFAPFFFMAALFGPSSAVAAPAPAPADNPAVTAQAYFDEWTSTGEAACAAKDPECPRYADSLYNAAIAFQRAGERNKAIAARTILVNPRYHLDHTEIGKKALFQLAEDYKALTEYARAADFYEAAFLKAPTVSEAPDGLVDATVLRLALGEIDRAIKNAELYDKTYGAKKPSMTVSLWMGIAAALIEANQLKDAKAILEQILPRVDKVGELQDKFLAHAWLAGVLTKQDDAKGAEREYGVVRTLWKSPEMQMRLMADAETHPRGLGKVLTVVGEALFFFAEQKRKEVDAIRYPEYKGSADKEQVMKHINTKVVDWIKKKRPAIEEAERAYLQVIELQPVAPPRWVIASASRVGKMWATFVTDFRAAPIPREWKQHGPVPGSTGLTFDMLRIAYYEKIDEAVEPQKQQAKAAFKRCTSFSAKFQYADDFSRSCQTWLEKNYHKEFVRVEEFIPSMRVPVMGIEPTAILTEPQPSK